MTNLFKKNTHCNFLLRLVLPLVSLLLSMTSYGVTLSGVIKGGDIIWANGMPQGNYITLSNWQAMSNLQPTQEWAPGTFIDNSMSKIQLLGSTGESVEVDFSVVGLEYNLGQASSHFTQLNSGSPAGFSACTTVESSTQTVKLIKENSLSPCTSDFTYASSDSYTPFQFVRPIVDVDTQQIVTAFRDAKVGSGMYSGSVYLSPVYLFRSPTGNWTYRKALSVPMTLSLKYDASNLISITVQGDGVIPPEYNTVNRTVSGKTQYVITANGYFTDGIKMTFENNHVYELAPITAGVTKRLPYSLDCTMCEQTSVVRNSAMQLVNNETTVQGQGDTIIVKFDIHYDNIGADDVETGSYEDAFIVFFEENL